MGGGLVGQELGRVEAVLALEEPVVGDEDDVGVGEVARGVELIDDLADPVVDRAQRLEAVLIAAVDVVDLSEAEARVVAHEGWLVGHVELVEARIAWRLDPGECAGVTRRGLRAPRCDDVPVRRRVIDLDVEGIGAEAGDRVEGVAVDQVGEVVALLQRRRGFRAGRSVALGIGRVGLVEGPVGVGDHPVVVGLVAVEEAGVADHGVPVVPARRHLGRVVVAVLVEELAGVAGPVAVGVQPHRDVVLEVELVVAAAGEEVGQHPGVVRVAPGQHRRPRRAAEGVGDVVAAEGDSLCGDQVERVRHHRQREPGERIGIGRIEVGQSHVVGLDHDDVRLRGRGCARRPCEQAGGHRAGQGQHCGDGAKHRMGQLLRRHRNQFGWAARVGCAQQVTARPRLSCGRVAVAQEAGAGAKIGCK